ncbi:hypothetical protein SORBI_3003G072801 [Sorghum bicolor]|uniref:Factor of DNA methylation 1-5/IDN2 domain-containing protein n=1 Tax=Sorghum bicolor TaxID=4558 RepID=A0A1B6Q1U1_SORBI|nr:hypothetical protein SORBI_3003G072801 [Sorghum bicolor]
MTSNDIPMADAAAGNPSELLVWPWTGIMATITTDGDATATSTLASRAQQHFAGVPTTTLQEQEAAVASANHHSHFLLLHFGKSCGAVGRFLRESGAKARTVEDAQKDGARHADALGAVHGEYERREKFLKAQSEEMARLLRTMEQENGWLLAELKEVTAIADNELPELDRGVDDEENEMLRAELDAISGEIQLRVDRIQELKECRTELHCSKVEKLVIEINSLEMEDREAKARDHVQMLHEKHKEEMEAINAKVVQLEKQLEQKEAQVSATCLLDMILQTGGNVREEECQHLYKLVTIWKECQEQERQRYQNAHVDLTKRHRMNRDELQETRQELIQCLESMMIGGFTAIGIKRMGQLDEAPFYHACKSKYRDDDPQGKAARLVSTWQEELKNASWNPFTAILLDGEEKDVVDEDDPKLRQLWTEYGDDTCNAVKNALRELHEYNPKGRQAVKELWNFREGRKATVAEVLKYIFEQLEMRN